MMDYDELFAKENIFVVVGASNDESKYGYKVFRDLKESGYNAIGVNNRVGGEEEILNTPSYKCLTDFYARIEELFNGEKRDEAIKNSVLVLVVPPAAGVEVLHEALELGISRVWFQPGAESEEALALCREHSLSQVHGECIMITHPRA